MGSPALDSTQHLEVEHHDQILIARLSRPSVLNALNSKLARELAGTLTDADADDRIRTVIICGAGSVFCAGADINELREWQAPAGGDKPDGALWDTLGRFSKPLIAAVRGAAVGGGFELVLHCDLVVASADATFALPETGIGLMPGAGATQLLPRAIGWNRAAEVIMCGRTLTATELVDVGLVNLVTDGDDVEQQALKLAEKIISRAPVAIRSAKTAMRASTRPLDEGLAIENALFAAMFETEDMREGVDAFLQKRVPIWRGR